MLVAINLSSYAQFGKLKGLMGKKDSTKTEEPKQEGGGGGGLMNKVMSKVAKGAFTIGAKMSGSSMLGNTDDLNTVDLSISFMQNLHPTEVQEIGQNFFNGWEPAGTGILMMFTSKSQLQMTKLEGDVKVDGVPANYASMGFYTSFTKGKEPKKIDITSKSGQNLSFTIEPPKQKVKLLSINGQATNASLDMSKDVVLEFADMPEDTKTPIMVQITGSTIGLKTLYTVGYFNPKKKIVIPPAMFRQMGVGNIGLSGCYLQVSRGKMENPTNVKGTSQNLKLGTIVYDGMFVNVTNKPTFSKGIEVNGTLAEVGYEVKKGAAIGSPNFAKMKTLGVMGFAAKGSTSYFDRTTKYKIGEGYETVVKYAEFPKFDNSVWDEVLNKAYVQITDILAKEFNVNIVPLEKVTNSAPYKEAKPYETSEVNTHDEFFITYKNTKSLSGIRPVTELGGLNSPEHKIMEVTGANALLKLTLNFTMNFKGTSAFMTPTLNYEIVGPLVGDLYSTSFLTGSVTGSDYFIKNKKSISPDELETKVLNINGLTNAFRKAMQDIKAKEKENGDYDIEWAAMNQ